MKNWREFEFSVNGFSVKAMYTQETIDRIFIPLLKKMTQIQEEKGSRILVFLAAPPGAGKTTISLFLEYLSQNLDNVKEIQSIGLDGFHHKSEYLKSHTAIRDGKEISLNAIKGCPETFDIDKVIAKLKALQGKAEVKWPIYDRSIHDVVEDQILIEKEIILLEGNWLLLKEEKWDTLRGFSDFGIMIETEERFLKDRLIVRKMKGGLSIFEASKFYIESDSRNVVRALKNTGGADLQLEMIEDGDLIKSFEQ